MSGLAKVWAEAVRTVVTSWKRPISLMVTTVSGNPGCWYVNHLRAGSTDWTMTRSSGPSLKLSSAHVPYPAGQTFVVAVRPVLMSTMTGSPALTSPTAQAPSSVIVATPPSRRAETMRLPATPRLALLVNA